MNKDTNKSGLKSSLDLAMERLAQKSGPVAQVTDEQKKALADVSQKAKAKIAEAEILYQDRLAKARAGDDPEKVAQQVEKLQAELSAERERIRSREESDKDRIRKGD